MSGFFGGGGGAPLSTDPLAANLSFTAGKSLTLPELVPLAPPGAPTVVSGAAGNPNGDYLYAITFVTAFGETPTGATAAITLVNQVGELSNIPVGPTGTTDRKIYRTEAGPGSDLRFVTALGDNVATVYTDNTADNNLGYEPSTANTALVPAQLAPGTLGYLSGEDALVLPQRLQGSYLLHLLMGDMDYRQAASELRIALGDVLGYAQNDGARDFAWFEAQPGRVYLGAYRTEGSVEADDRVFIELTSYDAINQKVAELALHGALAEIESICEQFVIKTLPTTTDPAITGALFTCTGAELAGLLAAGAKHILLSKGP